MYNIDKINKIKKYYKKYYNGIELFLINYEGLNLYIRIDKERYKNVYYLSYIDLNIMDKFNKKLINRTIIPKQSVDYICDILINQIVKDNKVYKESNIESDTDLVRFKANIDNIKYNYTFNLFIPSNIAFLSDVLGVIFSYMPHNLFELYNELNGALNHRENDYLYHKPFKFDLFKGKLDKIFDEKVINKGERCYKNHNIRFLELINNSYYAVIEDPNEGLYTCIIDYDKDDKMTTLACSCTNNYRCEHMYAVIEAIRNKEEYKYYKVRYVEENIDYYNKIFSNNYYLCLGIEEDRIFILYPNGEIQSLFLLDKNHKSMFEVVEDSEDYYLTNLIKEAENKRN